MGEETRERDLGTAARFARQYESRNTKKKIFIFFLSLESMRAIHAGGGDSANIELNMKNKKKSGKL